MKYRFALISLFLAIAGIPCAHANFPLTSPMGVLAFGPIVVSAAFAMIIEVAIVLILLRKKSLNITGLAIVLLFANVVSFVLFLVLLPSLFVQPPDILILLSEALAIIFEAYILASATHLSIFRKPKGMPLTFVGALVPVVLGNITSIVLGIVLIALLGTPSP